MIVPKITQAGAFLTKPIPFGLSFGKKTGNELRKLVYFVEVEQGGNIGTGMSSQFVMDFWFDKANNRTDFEQAITTAAKHGVETVQQYYNGNEYKPFAAARDRGDEFRDMAGELGTTRLGMQMVEAVEGAAILDALGKANDINSLDLVLRNNGFDLHSMSNSISEIPIDAILAPSNEVPAQLPFRHTIGLPPADGPDTILESEVATPGSSLEAEIKEYGIQRFKIKINNDVDASIARLQKIAKVIEENVGTSYVITLDGNEAFDGNWNSLLDFAHKFKNTTGLEHMAENTAYIEQPFHRDNLKEIMDNGIAAIKELKAKYGLDILIDESGDEHNSYELALEKGIYGGGFKTCKGIPKAVHDAAIALATKGGFNSGEDLTVIEPSDWPQSIHLYSTIKTIRDAELNGPFKTEAGTWLTHPERIAAAKHMPSLYRLDDAGNLKPIVNGNSFPTIDVLGPGFGSPYTCFDPKDSVDHLRTTIAFAD